MSRSHGIVMNDQGMSEIYLILIRVTLIELFLYHTMKIFDKLLTIRTELSVALVKLNCKLLCVIAPCIQ